MFIFLTFKVFIFCKAKTTFENVINKNTVKASNKQFYLKIFKVPYISILTQPCNSIDDGDDLVNDVTTTGSPKAVLASKLSSK